MYTLCVGLATAEGEGDGLGGAGRDHHLKREQE